MYFRPYFREIFLFREIFAQFVFDKNRNFSISHDEDYIFANKIRFYYYKIIDDYKFKYLYDLFGI